MTTVSRLLNRFGTCGIQSTAKHPENHGTITRMYGPFLLSECETLESSIFHGKSKKWSKMKTIFLYLFSIVFVNFMFAHTGPEIGAVLVGFVFVLRDYVQRSIGHYVLLVMLAGCGISFYMASPIVATASLVAFLAAEASDWAIYSSLPFKFQHRVLFSSVVGVAVDTLIFLPMIGVPLWPIFAIAWCSKMAAAVAVFGFYQVKAR